ncbi:MAG: hypothetical protein KJO55_04205 [Gammaproteobacteria bacterium]|nr:hypothetical protein [Gammaproteobacteria bacterium]NND61455.1 hypothetical protein [Gammaproteobacteria bacterium]
MGKRIGASFAIVILAAVAVTAIGQTLIVDNPAAADSDLTQIPSRGMTMESVEANFGSPANRRAPVGDPPITRWEYGDFIVYFEYKRVIHAVAKRPVS